MDTLQIGSLLFAAGFFTCAMAVATAIMWSFSDKRVLDAGFVRRDARRMA